MSGRVPELRVESAQFAQLRYSSCILLRVFFHKQRPFFKCNEWLDMLHCYIVSQWNFLDLEMLSFYTCIHGQLDMDTCVNSQWNTVNVLCKMWSTFFTVEASVVYDCRWFIDSQQFNQFSSCSKYEGEKGPFYCLIRTLVAVSTLSVQCDKVGRMHPDKLVWTLAFPQDWHKLWIPEAWACLMCHNINESFVETWTSHWSKLYSAQKLTSQVSESHSFFCTSFACLHYLHFVNLRHCEQNTLLPRFV